MVKLSKAGKMPCKSWSLQALDTCPGSKKADGELVDACKGCYATTGNYRFPNVKAPREHNREDWKRDEWVNDMVVALGNDKYFRWFDSGDVYDVRLANKIYEVCKATPHCKHWIPTRMHKFSKFSNILAKLDKLANTVVRKSSDNIDGTILVGARNSSTIVPTSDTTTSATICKAYERDGKCGECRACWDKNTAVIAYPAHGKKMISIIAKG